MKRTIEQPHAITLAFNQKRIRSDGELASVVISQNDQEIILTPQQAKSLAEQITLRLPWSQL